MDRSFTLGSTEEADNVKILQSCNGLLFCGGSGMPVFDYLHNPSTNQYKKLTYLDCLIDNSPYYSSAGLRITFDLIKSPHYKLVDARRTFCDIDIQIYSLETVKKSAMDRSFTLGSTEEADNVKILQFCNGLLFCGGSGMPVFDYVHNSSTNQYKKLTYLDCLIDNSPYYSSARLRTTFDLIKSPHYKLVDARRTFCDIDIQIYSLETGDDIK
nr:hypothetical protein [Tanacetum cinerariifolium]